MKKKRGLLPLEKVGVYFEIEGRVSGKGFWRPKKAKVGSGQWGHGSKAKKKRLWLFLGALGE